MTESPRKAFFCVGKSTHKPRQKSNASKSMFTLKSKFRPFHVQKTTKNLMNAKTEASPTRTCCKEKQHRRAQKSPGLWRKITEMLQDLQRMVIDLAPQGEAPGEMRKGAPTGGGFACGAKRLPERSGNLRSTGRYPVRQF